MVYIGIDPGKNGAMSIIRGGILRIIPYDKAAYLKALYSINTEAICCLEKVGAMPGQGVVSMFSFGETFGWLQGVLEAYHIPYELVAPQKWKKEFSVTSDKNTAIVVARRLFPDVELKRSERARKDDDNMAESLLMAEYARRKLRNE